MQKQRRVIVSFKVPQSLLAKIDAQAQAEHRSRSNFIELSMIEKLAHTSKINR